MKKYLIIYHRNGMLHSINYGDEKMINNYLKQGYGVAIFDDAKLAVEQLNEYQKAINE